MQQLTYSHLPEPEVEVKVVNVKFLDQMMLIQDSECVCMYYYFGKVSPC